LHRPRVSFPFYPGLFDQLAPFGIVLTDEPGEVGRRIGDELDALRREPSLELRAVENAAHFRIHLVDDLRRPLGRHEQTEPRIDRIARQGLAYRRSAAEIGK